MNLREAAQQALEALEKEPADFSDWLRTMKAARTALRAALEPETCNGMPAIEGPLSAMQRDQVTYGMSITLDGKRIDPASIYDEQKPVAWEYRHVCDEEWYRLIPRTGETLEDALAEIRGYCIGNRKLYEVRALYTAPPAPTWTQSHWTEYERGIVATERERIAAWVEDMCADLDAKTIANGIRNGGNDDIRAFKEKK